MLELQIRTFGQTRVLLGDQEVRWSAQSARDLLLYLLSFPEGRTRSQLFADLWEQDVNSTTRNRFRVTLHRLRTSLGLPGAVTEQHGRYRLAPAVWRSSDVYALYAGLNEAEHDAATDRTGALERAVQTYGGDFLAGEDAEWALNAREEHKSAYVRATLELSLLHCEHQDCGHSVQALVGALQADPYVGEQYHQRLMTCLSVVESKYTAIEHYRRFLKFLRDDVNDLPMADTLALAARVKAGEHICQRLDGPLQELPLARHCPLTPDGRCAGEWQALLDQDRDPPIAPLPPS
ncbi:AfsR/SARP family transcriptional regulator [Deinococcus aerophilus]|uniref:SARP family transcriptional regulator n=1 Tax=Deinococcus aerophilus TaxID=522488 RepID=A0ABQ2GZC7_9DEIO|nr:BTAD domain-containing putative transcriptional regulator [Deinococcus aerophilus]GGM19774.1 SARP family transcriptional regulator [Deinococcus aerophilus]